MESRSGRATYPSRCVFRADTRDGVYVRLFLTVMLPDGRSRFARAGSAAVLNVLPIPIPPLETENN